MGTVGQWLFLTGIVLLILGTGISLLFRKEGIGWRRVLGAGSNLGVSPERYVRGNMVLLVKALALTGVIMVVAAVLCLLALSLQRVVA